MAITRTYEYSLSDKNGKIVKGRIDARTRPPSPTACAPWAWPR